MIKSRSEIIKFPIKGSIVSLSDLNDKTFEKIGSGVAIIPKKGEVYAPFDGVCVSVFPTLHALCLKSGNGVELLIHLGIDTVNLNGKGFKVLIKEGQRFKKGQLISEFNIKLIKSHGYEVVCPTVITNDKNFDNIFIGKEGIVVKLKEYGS